jgi:thioredoxin reductase (NADPH)
VTVIHRRDSLRASNALQKEAFSDPKLSFMWDSAVAEVTGEKKVDGLKIRNLKTGEETLHRFDGLFVAIGYDPNTEIFKGQLEMDANGYLVAKNETETNIRGVFVAGDVHDFRYRQAVTAAADGCKAALDAERCLKESGAAIR